MKRGDLKLQGIYLEPQTALRMLNRAKELNVTVTELYNRILVRAVDDPALHEPIEGVEFGEKYDRRGGRKPWNDSAIDRVRKAAGVDTSQKKQTDVIDMHGRGFSRAAIAAITKVPYSKVDEIIRRGGSAT